MKKLLMIVLALTLFAGGASGQEAEPTGASVESTEPTAPPSEEKTNVEEPQIPAGPETAIEAEKGRVPVKPPSVEDRLRERFGKSWPKRTERVATGKGQKIQYNEAVTDVVTVGGSVEVEGYAFGDVVTVLGNARIGREAVVKGDVVTVLGNITVEPGGLVGGDAVCVLGTIVDPGGGIHGDKVGISGPLPLVVPAIAGHTIMALFLMKLFGVVATLLLAYLVVALMPNAIVKIGDQLARNPFISGLVGAGTLVASPLAFIILAITCIGILLVPLALAVCWFLGKVAVSRWIGCKLRTAIRGNSHRPYLDVTIGILLIALVSMVPFVGWLIKFLLVMAALGALVLTRFGTREGIVGMPAVASAVSLENVDQQERPTSQ